MVDRVSKRILIPASLLGICICGLFLSTFPSYPIFLVIYCLLAIFADMLYWPTMLKTVRLLGNEDEQGRMFGILEAGRGLMDTIIAFCALGIFSAFGSNAAGLRAAILFYAIVPGVIAILMFFLLDDDKKEAIAPEKTEVKQTGKSDGTILRALKNKNIWLVSFNVFFVYSVYCGLTYFIPFLSDIYLLSPALAGAYGIINQYALKMLGGPVGGVSVPAGRRNRWYFDFPVPLRLRLQNVARSAMIRPLTVIRALVIQATGEKLVNMAE